MLTRKEVSFEASLGHCVVRFELHAHAVGLRRDGLWFLCTTEFPVKLRVSGQAASHLNIIVLANLRTERELAVKKHFCQQNISY